MRLRLLQVGLLGLLTGPAFAQQPVLPGAPQPTQPIGLPPAASAPADYVLGRRYAVSLTSGTAFAGLLVGLTLEELTFETPDLGRLTVARAAVRTIREAGAVPGLAAGRPDYYDIGNGSRYFFGPSGRNLRQGEGTVQDVSLYFVGGNYGLTNNLSVGGYVSLIPGLGLQNQLLVLTPKLSIPFRADVSLGAGVLFMRIPDFDNNGNGYGVGLLYGAVTKGSADNNVTLGVGYGFAGNDVGSTPTLLISGQRRISRKVSLITENYLVASNNAVLGGLYGIKLNWQRTSFGMAALYAAYFDNSSTEFLTSYIVPVYLDFTFRFGKPYQAAPR